MAGGKRTAYRGQFAIYLAGLLIGGLYVGLIASAVGLAGYQLMLFGAAILTTCAFAAMLFYRPVRRER